MASLFRGNRKTAELNLNKELPHFDVYYIGRSRVSAKMGRECTKAIVEELIQKCKTSPELQRVSVTITSKGLVVREISDTNSRETSIPLYDVTYGAADKVYKNVFSFVTNYSSSTNLTNNGRRISFDNSRPFVCHAFYCRDAAMARAMVVYLVQAFKVGFESWKRDAKTQEARQVLRDKIEAGPRRGSSAGETIHKSNSSGSCSDGTLKQVEKDVINDLSPRQTVVSKTPPFETANNVDKVTKWLDRWLNVGGEKRTNPKSEVIDSDNEKQEIQFSKRMQECSNPGTINMEVDIQSELEDPEVRSVLEEMAEQAEKPESDDGFNSRESSSTNNVPSVIALKSESSTFLY